MKRFKLTAALLLAVCITCVFSSCTAAKNTEHNNTHGFEFHFYPEEYEEEYSEFSETLTLKADITYQLKIEAVCQNGTMDIHIQYADEDGSLHSVSTDAPYSDTFDISANTAEEVKITVSIGSDTKGSLIGELSASN